jgi:hypothetical protein
MVSITPTSKSTSPVKHSITTEELPQTNSRQSPLKKGNPCDMNCGNPDDNSINAVIIASGSLKKNMCKTPHFKNTLDRGLISGCFMGKEAPADIVFDCHYCNEAGTNIVSLISKKNPALQLDFCKTDCLNNFGMKISQNSWSAAAKHAQLDPNTNQVVMPEEVFKDLKLKPEDETRKEAQKKRKKTTAEKEPKADSPATNLRSAKKTNPSLPQREPEPIQMRSDLTSAN